MRSVCGIPCSLSSHAARAVLREVYAQIRARSPEDWLRICRVVTDVKPLPESGTADGTAGEWKAFHASADDPATWDYGNGETPGVVWLDEDLPRAELRPLIAHELGHACSTQEDRDYIGGPLAEWASELAADRFAYKWGFGREIGAIRRHRDRRHHGFAPGAEFTFEATSGEAIGYRVTRDLRIVRKK